MLCMSGHGATAVCAAHTFHKPILHKPTADMTYPEDIGSFWGDGPVPCIKEPLKLLLHEYDVAGITAYPMAFYTMTKRSMSACVSQIAAHHCLLCFCIRAAGRPY